MQSAPMSVSNGANSRNMSASQTPTIAAARGPFTALMAAAAEPSVPFVSSSDDPEALRNLIVNFLPPLMDESQLCQLFSQFGPIESVKIIYDRISGESRGYGFVKYQFFFSATYAISCLNRFSIAGKKLKVAYANADAAQEAYDTLRDTATGFTEPQKAALQAMQYNQSMYEL